MREEPLRAVTAQAQADPGLLPPGNILAVMVQNSAAPLMVTIACDESPNATKNVELDQRQATAVMVRFCLENNIPLPRRSRKNIRVVPGPRGVGWHLCLQIVIDVTREDDADN